MSSLSLPASARRRAPSRWALGVLALLGSMSALADELSIGVGAGLDRGKVDCVDPYTCDRSAAHAKLFAGYAFASGLELQALAFDAGHFDGGDTTPLGTPFGGRFKVSGVGVAAGYRWNFAPGWSLKGQLGLAEVRTRFDYSAPFSGEVSKSTTQPLVGLSLGYLIAPNWRLSVDYDETRFKAYTTRGSLRMLGVAAQVTF
jgi:Outer membrane protein beta-barrel domain